jgi:hypothetical protein
MKGGPALTFYIIVILAAIFAMPAKADETLKFRYMYHFTSNQTQQVGDVNGHVTGLGRLPGTRTRRGHVGKRRNGGGGAGGRRHAVASGRSADRAGAGRGR